MCAVLSHCLIMTKSTRCVNFPFFTIFSSTAQDLPVQGGFYDRLFCRQNRHTSEYDMLQDEYDMQCTPSAPARWVHNTAIDKNDVN